MSEILPPKGLRNLLRSIWVHLSTPADNPPTGASKIYIKSDGYLYTLNSSGVETRVGIAIEDSTTYAALTNKPKAIIYGTGAAPTPTGYPDGCIYLQHEA